MSTRKCILIVPTEPESSKEFFREGKPHLILNNTTIITDKEFKEKLRVSDTTYKLLQDKKARETPVGAVRLLNSKTKNNPEDQTSWTP